MKKDLTLYSFFLMLALSVGVHPALGQPTLEIAPGGGKSILYWPSAGTNYILQSTTNVASSNWVYVADAVPVTAATVSNTSPARFFRLTTAPAGMVVVPAGWFMMGNVIGDPDITDADPTNIYVSSFFMDQNLVTYGLWLDVYQYATNRGYAFVWMLSGKTTNHPAIVDAASGGGISFWNDAVKWCNARSEQAGLTPVYYTDEAFTAVYMVDTTNNYWLQPVYANWMADGYRLPTEAEWEKAARGGRIGTRFPWGNVIYQHELANYHGETNITYDLGPSEFNFNGLIGGLPYTCAVGSFPANGYGLYDMAGNVSQVVWDEYGTPYGQPSPINPTGPKSGDRGRLYRGGNGAAQAHYLRCANRSRLPDFRLTLSGFRCVRGVN